MCENILGVYDAHHTYPWTPLDTVLFHTYYPFRGYIPESETQRLQEANTRNYPIEARPPNVVSYLYDQGLIYILSNGFVYALT